MLDRIYYLAVL